MTRILYLLTLGIVFTHCQGQDFDITAFGAVNSTSVLSTKQIQQTIDEASKHKNGRVIVPKGNFLTGSLTLHSNVELHLKKGAILLGSTDVDDYYALSRTTATYNWKSLILCINDSNVKISGQGIIDGQGHELAQRIDDLFYEGKLDSSLYQFKEKRPKAHVRPQLIQFVNCTDVAIESVTIKNAASWVQVYDLCNNLRIHNVTVESVSYWNNDGIDIIDCKNVVISDSKINASDDGICIKSYKRNQEDHQPICDNIHIYNCKVRSSASAVKLGTSSFGGFKNVVIENIKVYDTYRSAIAIESWETGIIENVLVRNIQASNTGNALFIRLNKRPIYDHLPSGSINNVMIQNIKCVVPFVQPDLYYDLRGPALPFFHNIFPISISGYPDNRVTNISIDNIHVIYPGKGSSTYANAPVSRLQHIPERIEEYPEFSMFGELPAWGLYARHCDGISITNARFKIKSPDYRPAFVFDDVLNLNLTNIKIKGDNKEKGIIRSPQNP